MNPSLDVAPANHSSVAVGPRWAVTGPCLHLDGEFVHTFRKRASWEAVLLTAFEAMGWPADPIANPLPPLPGDSPSDRRERLRNTVKYLKRELPPATIRFWTDGDRVG